MTFRILWHDGWPYPVTGHPVGPDEEADSWFVQTREGAWHAVVERRRGVSLDEVWPELEVAMRNWLTAHVSGVHGQPPPTLLVRIRLHAPASGLTQLRPVVGGIVDTQRGQCYVDLAEVTRLPGAGQENVAAQAENRQPAVFNVRFRTTDHPLGIHLQFDALDFLEAVVQEYLRRRPEDLPLARPPA